MVTTIVILATSLFLVVQGATRSTQYAIRVAERFHLSRYAIGFLVIAVISILPETFISVSAALQGDSSFGLGVLLGSNVADLTLVVGLVALYAGRNINVEYRILKQHTVYPFILLIPIVLGFDGYYTRLEGLTLIVVGGMFYYMTLKSINAKDESHQNEVQSSGRDMLILIGSLLILLLGAYLTVWSAGSLAHYLGIPSILIGILVVALGTTMPELFFALKSVKQCHDDMAIGDILGTVLADATIVIGILALLTPFEFPKTTIYIAGIFMVAAAFMLFSFMRSGRSVTRLETFALFIFWLTFVSVEYIVNVVG